MLASTGKYAHFLDADGATEIKDFDNVFNIVIKPLFLKENSQIYYIR